MLGGFTRSFFALVHFALHIGAGVDSVVYTALLEVERTNYYYGGGHRYQSWRSNVATLMGVPYAT
jgi:hypothetical protein